MSYRHLGRTPGPVGRTSMELVEEIRRVFELRGEDVIRRSSGRVMGPPKHRIHNMVLSGSQKGGDLVLITYCRAKFALAHGYLPTTVDHKNQNHLDNTLDNLRVANMSLQQHNKVRKPRDLPRCVYRCKSGKPFKATVKVGGNNVYLGQYHTAQEASEVAERFLKDTYGESYFYRG